LLDGNARFCPHCGAKSTFLVNGLLKPWHEYIHDESEEYEPMLQPVGISLFSPVEDNEDDDLPF